MCEPVPIHPTVTVLVMLPAWAFGSGFFGDATTTAEPDNPSAFTADDVLKIATTVLWFVQLALMGLSTNLSWLAPLITIPASVAFYILGSEVSEERRRRVTLVPFSDTFTTLPPSDEEKAARLAASYRRVLAAAALYVTLLAALALLRHACVVPW